MINVRRIVLEDAEEPIAAFFLTSSHIVCFLRSSFIWQVSRRRDRKRQDPGSMSANGLPVPVLLVKYRYGHYINIDIYSYVYKLA